MSASTRALTRTIYRSLLATCRSVGEDPLRLRLPVAQSATQWMSRQDQHGFVPPRSQARELFPPAVLPSLSAGEALDAPCLEAEALRSIVRDEFRRALDATELDEQTRIGAGLHAIRVLGEQLAMRRRSSATTSTHEESGAAVLIECTSGFRGRNGPEFLFQYRVRITNVGAVPVQVVARTWDIHNADDSPHASVCRAPGLVGQSPRLLPGGDAFEYASGTTMRTAGGSVGGSFQCMALVAEGEPCAFDAEVGRFQCLTDDDEAWDDAVFGR